MDEIYRTYWRCKSCGNRWSYDCNLAGFNCRCPACGNMTESEDVGVHPKHQGAVGRR